MGSKLHFNLLFTLAPRHYRYLQNTKQRFRSYGAEFLKTKIFIPYNIAKKISSFFFQILRTLIFLINTVVIDIYLGRLSLDFTSTSQRSVNFTSHQRYSHFKNIAGEFRDAQFVTQRNTCAVKSDVGIFRVESRLWICR